MSPIDLYAVSSSSLPERLRGLADFAPPPGGWERLQSARAADRRRVRAGLFALAASVALSASLVTLLPKSPLPAAAPVTTAAAPPATVEIRQLIARSQLLEQRLRNTEPAVWNASLAAQAGALERSLEVVDLQLSYADDEAARRLWRDRVGLMSALVELHRAPEPALQYAAYQTY